MTLGEFAQTCARDPKLFDLWNQLWNLSFKLLEQEIGEVFSSATPVSKDPHRSAEFDKVREELEAECARRGIPYPNLSIKAFAQEHLQYKKKKPIVSEIRH